VLVYGNIVAYLNIHFEVAKLAHFVLLIVVCAASGVSLRVVFTGSALSLATMLWFAYRAGSEIFLQYFFVAFAGSFTAFGMALLMRNAILSTTRARLAAQRLRRKAEAQAEIDPLTGLPNRRHFLTNLNTRIAQAENGALVFQLAILDLDGFKPVNDLHGHAVGDALLREMGARLSHHAGGHLLARLGGDEFGLLIDGPRESAELLEKGRRLCEAAARPFIISGIAINISCSIGFATFPRHGRTAQQVYECADHALYHAKRSCRGDVVLFDDRHEDELGFVSRIDQTLRVSDLEKELFVTFQPQVDVLAGRVIAFEALARWHSPRLGMVSPDHFIAAAERSDLIGRITGILLSKALAAMADWPQDIGLSFNLSARDLVSTRSLDTICRIVTSSGIAPERLMLEITETSVMSDVEKALAALNRLAALGCRISLDDFGSGYSNFSYLHRFPLDQLKTDRSFVTRLGESGSGADIIKAIVDLCGNLGLQCLVEGVETPEEKAIVMAAGARYMQGYLFAKPMLPGVIADYLAGFGREQDRHRA
jgi:diguanylate cyclase (GGDEF)-like protein